MEVPQIEEMRLSTEVDEAEHRKEVRPEETGARKCIYDKDMECTAPNCDRKICENCPYGCRYTFAYTMKDVFTKIISLAIFLAKSDDVLRDVIALISKDKEVDLGPQEPPKQKPARKIISNRTEAEKKVHPGRVRAEPRTNRRVGGIQAKMAAEISSKVADINEALANPNGSSDKPLV